jgi:hypothetical protein
MNETTRLQGTEMIEETLYKPWIIFDHDYQDYSCEEHAIDYANTIDAQKYGDTSYGIEKKGYGMVADIYEIASFAVGESDYPAACACGRYLDVPLTAEGQNYLAENDFPAWLKALHQ